MGQQGAPGRQQPLPERLVCNWGQQEEQGEQSEHHCKGPRGTGGAGLSAHPSTEEPPAWEGLEGPAHTFHHWWLQRCREQSRTSPGDTAGTGTAQVLAQASLRSRLQEKLAGNGSDIPGREQPSLKLLFYFPFTPQSCSVGWALSPHTPGHTLVPVQVDLAALLTSLGGGATLCPLSFSLCIMTVSTFSPNTLDLQGTGGAC